MAAFFSCRLPARRRAVFRALAVSILAARGPGRPLAPAAWAGFAGLAFLVPQAGALGWRIVPTLALSAALALIFLYDARYFVIPDGLVAALLLIGFLILLPDQVGELPERLAAAGGGYGALRLVDLLYERLRGTAGIGQGDAKLFAVAGLWLGFQGLPSVLLAACASALLSALLLYRQQGVVHARDPLPFGPHLALGVWLVWAAGPLISG